MLTKKSKLKHQCYDQICVFSDAYINVKGVIADTDPNNTKRNKSVAFKSNAPFIKGQWYTNWQRRRPGCCNANVQFT